MAGGEGLAIDGRDAQDHPDLSGQEKGDVQPRHWFGCDDPVQDCCAADEPFRQLSPVGRKGPPQRNRDPGMRLHNGRDEPVRHARAGSGADGDRRNPQFLPGVLQDGGEFPPHQVYLVQRHDDWEPGCRQRSVDIVIGLTDSGGRVQQQDDHVGLLRGAPGDLRPVHPAHFAEAGGVYQDEGPESLLQNGLSGAGHRSDRGNSAAHHLVEEGGFAGVDRPDDGQARGCLPLNGQGEFVPIQGLK
ncbi:MAG: hypothetical protein NZ769_02035 [Anaerolineae bacterium]|nr:hypothetical protein [Anaerolineae bacterium]